jgi:WD40 repeat protein
VIYHPRGELVISADAGGRVYVWRALNGEVIRTIETPSPINHIALSPDGALIASAHGTALAADDTSLRLWNVQTGERIREYTDMTDWVIHVTFSPDGNVLLAADHSQRVCGWDMNSGEMVLDLAVGTLAYYNPQNDLIAIAHETLVDLVSVRGGQTKMQLQHGETVSAMAFNTGGELLATGLANGDVVLWGVPERASSMIDSAEVEQIRVQDAARSGRYALQLISLSCNRAQERDGDEVFIRLDDQTIWRVTALGRKMRPHPNRPHEIDTFDFSRCQMHGKSGWQPSDVYAPSVFRFGGLTGPIELELWEEDSFFRGGDDCFGRLVITPAQAGQNMIRTVIGDDRYSYTLTYGVLFE